MIEFDALRNYFPPMVQEQATLIPYMIKELIQCQILEFLSHSPYVSTLSFIGGTNLRLVSQIDRFSEGLDFDCKDMGRDEFLSLTDSVVDYLARLGYSVHAKEKESDALVAYRCSIYFPELLFSLGLSGYRNARFMVKVEMQDQGFAYDTQPVFIRRMGFYFPFPAPPMEVLTAMKLSALLSRAKGRDFYDALFLLHRSDPCYGFLEQKCGIRGKEQLKASLFELVERTDLKKKQQDFEHLLFDKRRSSSILSFASFIGQW